MAKTILKMSERNARVTEFLKVVHAAGGMMRPTGYAPRFVRYVEREGFVRVSRTGMVELTTTGRVRAEKG